MVSPKRTWRDQETGVKNFREGRSFSVEACRGHSEGGDFSRKNLGKRGYAKMKSNGGGERIRKKSESMAFCGVPGGGTCGGSAHP